MTASAIRFSRLLRIFELNEEPAYIIELEENNKKTLYISFVFDKGTDKTHLFESYNQTQFKKEFKDLSNHCLMSQCTDASFMFCKSPITHFESDCLSLICGDSMFDDSQLINIKGNFPLLKKARFMFYNSKINEININFPLLKNGRYMFCKSYLKKITSSFPELEIAIGMFGQTKMEKIEIDFPNLKDSTFMFSNSNLKEITSQFPKLKHKALMFHKTPVELKFNCPHYFT